ncbi:hypothetical protein [Blastopirellula marina]|uniref:Uncharacterized protein n=1 Tax=Blastopirellula marina TaxID=124 RepID=A0A2S8GQP5_9BACT|nr:hypothetical protein [Blastopirellula marina]PQO46758.1 hypothetical protein C5Y93_07965 [Blastopirellula marina]
MTNLPARKAEVADLALRIGVTAIDADWTGCDAVWPILERIRSEGAVVVIKLDGERRSRKYTVVISGEPLGEDFFRTDTASLEEGLAAGILFYAERRWN